MPAIWVRVLSLRPSGIGSLSSPTGDAHDVFPAHDVSDALSASQAARSLNTARGCLWDAEKQNKRAGRNGEVSALAEPVKGVGNLVAVPLSRVFRASARPGACVPLPAVPARTGAPVKWWMEMSWVDHLRGDREAVADRATCRGPDRLTAIADPWGRRSEAISGVYEAGHWLRQCCDECRADIFFLQHAMIAELGEANQHTTGRAGGLARI